MANSERTKSAIANAFIQLLHNNSLDRITVTAIAKECGINRQTFYYHFHDVYDLLSWTVEQHMNDLLESTPETDWQHRLYAVLKGLEYSKDAVSHLIRTTDAPFVYFLLRDKIKELVLSEFSATNNEVNPSSPQWDFIADFYTGGLLEVVLTWASEGMRESPETIVERLEGVMNKNVYDNIIV